MFLSFHNGKKLESTYINMNIYISFYSCIYFYVESHELTPILLISIPCLDFTPVFSFSILIISISDDEKPNSHHPYLTHFFIWSVSDYITGLPIPMYPLMHRHLSHHLGSIPCTSLHCFSTQVNALHAPPLFKFPEWFCVLVQKSCSLHPPHPLRV